jgi:hypothetical protein
MKLRIALLILLGSLFFGTFYFVKNNKVKISNFSNAIAGMGDYRRETREISSFTSIDLRDQGHVHFKQNDNFKLEVEGQDNILALLETYVENNQLVIRFKTNTNVSFKKLNIYVEAPQLEKVLLSGSGEISMDAPVKGDNLSLELSGSGKIESANLMFSQLDNTVSGSGTINVSGKATKATYDISGSGNISAQKLDVQEAEAELSGSGNIHCGRVIQRLDVNLRGSGNIVYSGENPSVKSRITGSGNVYQKND